jgi:hypothetical protein
MNAWAWTIGASFLFGFAVSGCNDDCSGTYHCPAMTMSIVLPPDISARVRSAAGDTCTPTVDTTFPAIDIASTTRRPCRVTVQLDDGTVEQSDVTFEPLHCCGYTVTSTGFSPADAGARG